MIEKNGNGAPSGLQFDEGMCERYLFGELTEAEQERFEAAYFDDDVFFDRFVAVKTELLDLYSRGELDAEKRSRMEPHFLETAPRRRRIAESGEFIQAVSAISDRSRSTKAAVAVVPEPSFFDSLARFFTVPRLASAAVLMIAAIGGIFLLSRSGQEEQVAQQPPAEVNRQVEIPAPLNSTNVESRPSEPDVATNPSPSNQDAPSNPSTSPRSDVAIAPRTNTSTESPNKEIPRDPDLKDVAGDPRDKNDDVAVGPPDVEPSITLNAGATRAVGAGNTLTIPARARAANLNLVFRGEQYSTYTVTITNIAGTEIFRNRYGKRSVRDTSGGLRNLTLRLNDTSRLVEKDYIVKIEGQHPGKAPETIEEYYFHVRRAAKSSN